MSQTKLKLFSFQDNTRILHLSWFAFFLSFLVWFNHAPLMAAIRDTFALSDQQVKALLILNVALTIPARIIIGMLVDKFGPRIMYALLLGLAGPLCLFFAVAENYQQLALARFLLGFVGAGFVIGIRLISEWYPAKQVGLAEGIYGGWGNFGSSAAAIMLPTIALLFGGDDGWRYAIGLTGVIAMAYALVFYKLARNTPKGSTYFKPKRTGAMEVSSRKDFVLYLLMNIPMYAALAVLTWKLGPGNLAMLEGWICTLIYLFLTGMYLYQSYHVWRVNREVFTHEVAPIDRYSFSQVAILDIAYMVTFGSELAVVSMLPLFFMDTFELSVVQAGLIASIFAGLNLVMRPAGGLLSDRFGRRTTLLFILAGLAVGYFLMGLIDSSWPLLAAIAVTIFSSLFVNAGNGAVFAVVPLIKRRLTGQIAGMAGAYGNIGGVTFLTVLSFTDASAFFMVIAVCAVVSLIASLWLREPSGQMAEILPDGTVQMIEVH